MALDPRGPHIAETSPEAAVLLIWSAFEGALLWVAHKRDIAPKRHLPARSLIQQLTVDGILSDNQTADRTRRHRMGAPGLGVTTASPHRRWALKT